MTAQPSIAQLDDFRTTVYERGRELYRVLPWRENRDPYGIMLSEIMLQQTQVKRVEGYWSRWLETFPTVDALAAAPLSLVLEMWQGLGYNRRAVNLQRAAQTISEHHGEVPTDHEALLALPGIGPATAAGVRVFAFGLPDVYLETNVRAVFIHELFRQRESVSDRELLPLVEATCDPDDPAGWYYALLDYGSYLKSVLPNPSRRSATHSVQSRFEGSHRQKRAFLLRAVLAGGEDTETLARELSSCEVEAGRDPIESREVYDLLVELAGEGFIYESEGRWSVGNAAAPSSESS